MQCDSGNDFESDFGADFWRIGGDKVGTAVVRRRSGWGGGLPSGTEGEPIVKRICSEVAFPTLAPSGFRRPESRTGAAY